MEQIRKCTSCKKNYDLEHYTKGNRILNQCLKCRNVAKKSMNKTKCIHGRIKYSCIDCGGGGICLHNKHKSNCKKCNNPVDITIKYMIKNSKKHDIKKNRYNESEFVDYQYLFNLIDIFNDQCFYCDCHLQYTNFTNNLATIERINNELGHIKSNVLISCYKCNVSKVGSH